MIYCLVCRSDQEHVKRFGPRPAPTWSPHDWSHVGWWNICQKCGTPYSAPPLGWPGSPIKRTAQLRLFDVEPPKRSRRRPFRSFLRL